MAAENPSHAYVENGRTSKYAEKVADRFGEKYALKALIDHQDFPKANALNWGDSNNAQEVTTKDFHGVLQMLKDAMPEAKLDDQNYLELAFWNVMQETKAQAESHTDSQKIYDINVIEPGDKVFVKDGMVFILRKPNSNYADFGVNLYPWTKTENPPTTAVEPAPVVEPTASAPEKTTESSTAPAAQPAPATTSHAEPSQAPEPSTTPPSTTTGHLPSEDDVVTVTKNGVEHKEDPQLVTKTVQKFQNEKAKNNNHAFDRDSDDNIVLKKAEGTVVAIKKDEIPQGMIDGKLILELNQVWLGMHPQESAPTPEPTEIDYEQILKASDARVQMTWTDTDFVKGTHTPEIGKENTPFYLDGDNIKFATKNWLDATVGIVLTHTGLNEQDLLDALNTKWRKAHID